jgi:hypothetical protein
MGLNVSGIIVFLAEKGKLAGFGIGAIALGVKKIPSTAVSTFVRKTCHSVNGALPTTHSNYEKEYFILVDGKKTFLNELKECTPSYKYMFKVLMDKEIPFEEKQKTTVQIFKNHLDLGTMESKIKFLFCILTMLYIFYFHNMSAYLILMQNLIKAIKEGKISKRLARFLIKKLLKKGVNIDPELIDLAEFY